MNSSSFYHSSIATSFLSQANRLVFRLKLLFAIHTKAQSSSIQVVEGEVEQPGKRRKLDLVAGKRRSFVWEHFDVISDQGKLRAQCSYCKDTHYRAEGHFGTSNCIKHLKTCKPYLNATNKASLAKKMDRGSDFDVDVFCKLFADAIVTHGYPLTIVEDEGLRKLFVYLNPKVAAIPTSTIKRKVEALVAAQKGRKEANGNGVIEIKDSDVDVESVEYCSVLN